jgi:hypothetical protein
MVGGKRALASRSADPAGVGGWTSNCSIFAHEKSFSLVSGQSKIHQLDQADQVDNPLLSVFTLAKPDARASAPDAGTARNQG